MSKKKKKKPSAAGSVLDEPILKAKESPDDEAETPAGFLPMEENAVSDIASGGEIVTDDGWELEPEAEPENGPEDGPEDALEDDFPDGAGDDSYYDDPYHDKPPLLERLIEYTSAALSVFMLGASFVFWFVMLRYLLRSPYALADPTQIRVLLAGCAVFPAIVAIVQHKLRRPVSAERWLICLCISGALTVLLVIIAQTLIRHAGYSFSELPLTLCCAVSGSALPAAIFLGLRLLFMRFKNHLHAENSKDWDTVRRDVLSLTGFDRA